MKKEKKVWTLAEFVKAGGIASAKKRLGGKTKQEVSEYMSKVRRKESPKKLSNPKTKIVRLKHKRNE
jgi:hypothetical protein